MYYESTKGIFDVKIPLFSASSARGYKGKKQLEEDLVQASKFLVNLQVEQNKKYIKYAYPVASMSFDSEQSVAVPMQVEASQSARPSAENVDDFDTNNQYKGVDEADTLKTNGKHGFVAYGDYLHIWEVKTGHYVTNVTLPPLDVKQPIYYEKPIPIFSSKSRWSWKK